MIEYKIIINLSNLVRIYNESNFTFPILGIGSTGQPNSHLLIYLSLNYTQIKFNLKLIELNQSQTYGFYNVHPLA